MHRARNYFLGYQKKRFYNKHAVMGKLHKQFSLTSIRIRMAKTNSMSPNV